LADRARVAHGLDTYRKVGDGTDLAVVAPVVEVESPSRRFRRRMIAGDKPVRWADPGDRMV
jgi:hypothetical protein